MTISEWINDATTSLRIASIQTARLDAEVILAHALGQSRTWLIAHQNDNIDDTKVLENASKLLAKRLERVPVAYLTNHKEFYNRSFFVNESVLIPPNHTLHKRAAIEYAGAAAQHNCIRYPDTAETSMNADSTW